MSSATVSPMPSAPLGEALQGRLVEFVRLARRDGFRVGMDEEMDALRVARCCGMMHRRRLYWGLRSLLCSGHEDWQRFERLFDGFWMPAGVQARHRPVSGAAAGPGDGHRPGGGTAAETGDADGLHPGAEGDAGPGGVRRGASDREALARSDFRFIADAGQMRAMEQLVERMARHMRRRVVRRQRIHRQGRRVHLRRTLRNSLRYGGIPLDLAFRQRRRRQPRLILITDVSRSMSLYSYVFLRFARGIVNAFRDADAFAFHTRLVHITDALRQPDLSRVRHQLALISGGWSGGTRIGESLAVFCRDYGRMPNSRTVVVIVSDGLDTGPPALLGGQLEILGRRCRKIVWLNPLLGRPGYEPRTGGMMAALPHLDVFAPAHSLQSLLALEPVLTNL